LTKLLLYVPDQLVLGNMYAFEPSGLIGLQLFEDVLDHEALLNFLFMSPHSHCLWIISYFVFVQDISLRCFIYGCSCLCHTFLILFVKVDVEKVSHDDALVPNQEVAPVSAFHGSICRKVVRVIDETVWPIVASVILVLVYSQSL